jgi:glycosyltransferase involved in cell wall biosynthesis
MKIAHINNTSGIASILSTFQKKQGHEADVFVFNKLISNQFGGNMINYKSPLARLKLFRKLQREYDIWHYHYPYGSLKRSLEGRNAGKTYLKHYHGDDIRGKKDTDFCLVSTPDLLDYTPNGKWLPNPIDFDEISKNINSSHVHIDTESKRIKRIAHYPYYRIHSSTTSENYSTGLNELRRENKCEIVEILNFSHTQTLQMVQRSDIVIGKIMPNVGWFGKFELEGMALRKPVLAYVSDYLYEKYRPPIYRTTKETLKKDVIRLMEDENEIDRLSKEGYEYVRKNHAIENVITSVNKYYSI